MTDMTSGHEPFAELAAGYAVDALDPADEEDFLPHLRECGECQQALSEFTEVAAQLAHSHPGQQVPGPPPDLGGRIMAAATRQPQRSAPFDDLAGHRRRRAVQVAVAAAAAAVLIAAGIIWGLRPEGGGGPIPPAAGCVRAGSCHEVVLTARTSRAGVATVVVAGRMVWLTPAGLRPDDTARQIYVLWQIIAGRAPRAVGTFDVRGNRQHPVLIGSLAVAFIDTRAFAVTLEPGRTAPAVPSHPVAMGLVSS